MYICIYVYIYIYTISITSHSSIQMSDSSIFGVSQNEI